MNKKFKIISTLGLTATTLGLGLLNIGNAFAWGPERTTFTMEDPAEYPVFNSITNNPTIGDERDFVRVGEIDADVTELTNEVEVVPGRQYLVYIYFHNNASSTYNDKAHNNSGVALRTRMSSAFATVLTPSEKGKISATITADNTNPLSVWDEAYMTTKTDKVLMHYVAGSAKIYNDWKANGSVMPSSLFTEEGTLIGLNALNGVIPGCEEYHGVVTYVLQAEELGGSIDKTVSLDGKVYGESVNAKPGDTVYYQLAIANTGDVALTNATVKDQLPAGLELVPGSVGLRANKSEKVDTLSDNILGTGYNLGTIGTGNTVYITYQAKVTGEYDCKGKELVNGASLVYDSNEANGDKKEDAASVVVKAENCSDPEESLDNCDTNPSLEGCESEKDKNKDPVPDDKKTCATNPEMEGCKELPNTGPLEITIACLILLGIIGGGFYFYRSKKTLNKVEAGVSGKDTSKSAPKDAPKAASQATPKEETKETVKDSSQKPDNMVK